jgi:hypothetical protein
MDRKRNTEGSIKLSPNLLSIVTTASNAIEVDDINLHVDVNSKIIKIEQKYVRELNSYLFAACLRMQHD